MGYKWSQATMERTWSFILKVWSDVFGYEEEERKTREKSQYSVFIFLRSLMMNTQLSTCVYLCVLVSTLYNMYCL